MLKTIGPHLKGIVAALLPIGQLVVELQADGTLDSGELMLIGAEVVAAAAVWLTPAPGYVRPVDEKAEPLGKHEDRDNDGVPDAIELAENDAAVDRSRHSDGTPLYNQTQRDHTSEWPEPRS